jgi:hypothetical protein
LVVRYSGRSMQVSFPLRQCVTGITARAGVLWQCGLAG